VYLFFSVILGDIIETLKENGYEYTWGNVTVMLAEAFGFCWGVEKAVQISYEARKQFPKFLITKFGSPMKSSTTQLLIRYIYISYHLQ
jgi:hypothetical protein